MPYEDRATAIKPDTRTNLSNAMTSQEVIAGAVPRDAEKSPCPGEQIEHSFG
jgi:hypothetical protein